MAHVDGATAHDESEHDLGERCRFEHHGVKAHAEASEWGAPRQGGRLPVRSERSTSELQSSGWIPTLGGCAAAEIKGLPTVEQNVLS
jgi:hypothetical protein